MIAYLQHVHVDAHPPRPLLRLGGVGSGGGGGAHDVPGETEPGDDGWWQTEYTPGTLLPRRGTTDCPQDQARTCPPHSCQHDTHHPDIESGPVKLEEESLSGRQVWIEY